MNEWNEGVRCLLEIACRDGDCQFWNGMGRNKA